MNMPVRTLAASQSFEQDQSVLLENDAWLEDWQDMAQRITADWIGDKSAVEIISELRR